MTDINDDPPRVRDVKTENGIKWTILLQTLILVSITGSWTTTWYLSKTVADIKLEFVQKTGELVGTLNSAVSRVDHKVDLNTAEIIHSNKDCIIRLQALQQIIDKVEVEVKDLYKIHSGSK